MGLFDFVGEIASATIKVAATPITVVDIAVATTGNEPTFTKDLLKSAGKDLEKAEEELL